MRSRAQLALLAAVSALLLGLALTLGRALVDDRILGEADLPPLGLEPLLAVIPAASAQDIPMHGGRRRGPSPERA
jgi:hypothetical protein